MPSGLKFPLAADLRLLRPGMRVAAAVSGGADSVALLRLLGGAAQELGIVLSAAHLHHGIRGEEADRDAQFTADLAAVLGLPLLRQEVDTRARSAAEHESLEEAARNLRYSWFRELLATGQLDAIATAHTLDDQAETVLHKLIRGAWTEGLGGIHPILQHPHGIILRPLLRVRRSEIETYLHSLGQSWCDDSTNRDEAYTRNRIRHQLLPQLASYNPQAAAQLANLAAIARDEESYWQAELDRILPSLLLPGRAVRGGGRAASTHPEEAALAIEVERLLPLHPALRRRVLRAAAQRLGHALDYAQTERLLAMCGFTAGPPSRRETITAALRAERTPRELRLLRAASVERRTALPEYTLPIPGEVAAESFHLRLRAEVSGSEPLPSATLRTPRAGDRVKLRYTSAPKRLREVFERLHILSADRAAWPILAWQGEIIWMRDAEVESNAAFAAGLTISAQPLP